MYYIATYFRADADAVYVESHIIDLSAVDSCVALYPSPDNVVSVDECAAMALDGCFIGACTTAEEELILAAVCPLPFADVLSSFLSLCFSFSFFACLFLFCCSWSWNRDSSKARSQFCMASEK